MPDKLGNLTKDEVDNIINVLREKGITGDCLSCKVGGATVLAQVVHLPVINLMQGYAHVMLRCNNCGFTRFFNAGHLGVPSSDKWGQDDK